MQRLIYPLIDLIRRYALKFGVVGLIGFATDVGIFNLLRLGVFGTEGFWYDPLGAKIISVTCSTLVAWFGSRYWTFRELRRSDALAEFAEFAVVSIAGLGISLAILYLSHYVFGFTSLLADNISSNVIGLALATAFRFLMYRYWVYGHHRSGSPVAAERQAAAAAEVRATQDDDLTVAVR